jgi:hypothetical protein
VQEEADQVAAEAAARRATKEFDAAVPVAKDIAEQHLAELIASMAVKTMAEVEEEERLALENRYWNRPYLAKLRTYADIEKELVLKAQIAAKAARMKAAAVDQAARVKDAVAATTEGVLLEGLLAIAAELAAGEIEHCKREKARKAAKAEDRRVAESTKAATAVHAKWVKDGIAAMDARRARLAQTQEPSFTRGEIGAQVVRR